MGWGGVERGGCGGLGRCGVNWGELGACALIPVEKKKKKN